MTTHLEKAARTRGPVASFPARKTQIPWIVPAAALAVVVAVAALVMYVGTDSVVAPAIPATQVQQVPPLAKWAVPETDAAGIEYSPANPYVRPQTSWAVPEMNAAGIEYSPANPYVRPQTNWAPPEMNTVGIEYSPANPYVPTETAPTPPIRAGQGGPR